MKINNRKNGKITIRKSGTGRKGRKSQKGKKSAVGRGVAVLVSAVILLLVKYQEQWIPLLEHIGKDDWHYDAVKGNSSKRNLEGELEVHFLDVGQGNAILITNGDASLLLDGGNRDYSSMVVSYLQRQNINRLDYILNSHYDSDHIHGLIGALHVFSVGTVLDGDYEWDTKTYVSFRDELTANGCSEIHPQVGEVYSLGDAEFTIVCPDDYEHEESNDNSIGIRLVYGDTSFLICGDADSKMEQWMMESGQMIDSDVLLCSHHGSAYSTSEEFLEAVSPEAAVISCGEDNSYGHPSERVMNLLKDYGCDVYRTDKQSTIVAVSDGQEITFQKEPTEDYSPGE